MKFIEQVIDGIVCAVAIIAVVAFALFAVNILTVVYGGNSSPHYPKETAAPKIEGYRYEKDNFNFDSTDNDDPIYWRYAERREDSDSANG